MSTEPDRSRARSSSPKPNACGSTEASSGGDAVRPHPVTRDGNRRPCSTWVLAAANSVRIPRRFRWPSWALSHGVLTAHSLSRDLGAQRSRNSGEVLEGTRKSLALPQAQGETKRLNSRTAVLLPSARHLFRSHASTSSSCCRDRPRFGRCPPRISCAPNPPACRAAGAPDQRRPFSNADSSAGMWMRAADLRPALGLQVPSRPCPCNVSMKRTCGPR